MAKLFKFSSFFLISLLIFMQVRADQPIIRRSSRARAFIELQCQTTLYHDLCIRCLSKYIGNFTSTLSHHKLAQIALNVALDKAESTRAYVTDIAKKFNETMVKDSQAIDQCLSQINDGVDQLTNSIKETQSIKEDGKTSNFPWHASNVQTWMSTALTDASMCVDGFSGQAIGGKTRALIKAKVLNLEEVTSIALALFNRFAAKYGSSNTTKPKV